MSERFDYEDMLVSSDPAYTAIGMFVSGFDKPKLTPVMVDAENKVLVIWDGTPGTAVGLSVLDGKPGAGGQKAPYYKSGSFNIELIQWPDATTEAAKYSAFAGSAISVGTLA
ncbi:head decoration protein [Endozoicomonas lisbonensis]|uniref:head decoration protein n=1 Tax=Endozoicomonas lisbonensis TaxID=3120522 RepID=UPI00339232F4